MTDEELALLLLGRQTFIVEKLRRENAELRKALAPKPVEAPGL